jgi:tetratricopeptide (TPR) repeat protein
MQEEKNPIEPQEQKNNQKKNWMIAIGGVLVLGAILFLSDRPAQTPSGIDLIRTGDQYIDANNKAQRYGLTAMQKYDNGEKLTEDDLKNLKESVKYFEAMRIFQPQRIQSNFGAGKCYMILGEKEKAAERFEQAVFNRGYDPEKDRPDIVPTGYEAMALLSEVSLDLAAEEVANYNSLNQANDVKGADDARKKAQIYYEKAFNSANQAVISVPTSPKYLVDRANVYLVMKKEDLAKKDIAKAKALAPNDPKVKMAAGMVGL